MDSERNLTYLSDYEKDRHYKLGYSRYGFYVFYNHPRFWIDRSTLYREEDELYFINSFPRLKSIYQNNDLISVIELVRQHEKRDGSYKKYTSRFDIVKHMVDSRKTLHDGTEIDYDPEATFHPDIKFIYGSETEVASWYSVIKGFLNIELKQDFWINFLKYL